MTTANFTRATLRRAARTGLAGAALLAAVHGAAADEGGLGDILSSIFGGRPAPQAAPAPQTAPAYRMRRAPQAAWTYEPRSYEPRSYEPRYVVTLRRPHPHPLTVRLHPTTPRMVAQAPSKPGVVSIFEDRTLRRGDAVMTARGVRVFAGSASFPYRAEDFVSLKDAKSMDRDTAQQLAQLDRLPRG